jgi:hypothetical protein
VAEETRVIEVGLGIIVGCTAVTGMIAALVVVVWWKP